jgi:hypothetical protein
MAGQAAPVVKALTKAAGMASAGGSDTKDLPGNAPSKGASALSYLGGSNLTEGLSPVSGVFNMGLAVINAVGSRRQDRQTQANIDRNFEENVRRWGVEFALQEFAIRKGISLQEAEIAYRRMAGERQFASDRMAQSSALATAGMSRAQAGQRFAWEAADRKQQVKMQKAMAKGMIQGLTGRWSK